MSYPCLARMGPYFSFGQRRSDSLAPIFFFSFLIIDFVVFVFPVLLFLIFLFFNFCDFCLSLVCSTLYLPLTRSDRHFFNEQRSCRIHSSWMVTSLPTVITPAPSDSSLDRLAFLWMTRTAIVEVVLLAVISPRPSRYLPPTACDTTRNSLRCRIYRKLSSDFDCSRTPPNRLPACSH